MNKVDLVRSVTERQGLSRKEADALVDGIFHDIEVAVCSGEAVKIPGFGQFKVRDRPARMGRNPATGESIKIAAKRVFKFLPAKALKDAVMNKKGARAARKGTVSTRKTTRGSGSTRSTAASRGRKAAAAHGAHSSRTRTVSSGRATGRSKGHKAAAKATAGGRRKRK